MAYLCDIGRRYVNVCEVTRQKQPSISPSFQSATTQFYTMLISHGIKKTWLYYVSDSKRNHIYLPHNASWNRKGNYLKLLNKEKPEHQIILPTK